jgi:hypothetical protein
VRSDAAGFSFVGVVFESSIVAQVLITSGQGALGDAVQDLSDGGDLDLAVMDDYLYAEPQALPWRALADRAHSMVFLEVDPQLAPLRGEGRFRELVRKVGLPGAVRAAEGSSLGERHDFPGLIVQVRAPIIGGGY